MQYSMLENGMDFIISGILHLQKAESENADVVLCGFYKFSDKEKFRPDVSRMNWRNIWGLRRNDGEKEETVLWRRNAASFACRN